METIKIEKDDQIAELIKCKSDEILFVRYDPARDPEATSGLLDEIFKNCTDLEVPCLFLPMSDDEVFIELEQWDADRLRNFDSKLQELIRKKSPIILT